MVSASGNSGKRRGRVRVPLRAHVRLRATSREYEGVTENLSEVGLGLFLNPSDGEALAVGEEVEISVPLTPQSSPLVKATITRVKG